MEDSESSSDHSPGAKLGETAEARNAEAAAADQETEAGNAKAANTKAPVADKGKESGNAKATVADKEDVEMGEATPSNNEVEMIVEDLAKKPKPKGKERDIDQPVKVVERTNLPLDTIDASAYQQESPEDTEMLLGLLLSHVKATRDPLWTGHSSKQQGPTEDTHTSKPGSPSGPSNTGNVDPSTEPTGNSNTAQRVDPAALNGRLRRLLDSLKTSSNLLWDRYGSGQNPPPGSYYSDPNRSLPLQIGRASCRERVSQLV